MNLLDNIVKVKQDGLFLIVLGASGSGKSHFIGTYPGRTLLLYGAGESHGPSSAIKQGGDNLLAMPWDRDKDVELPADKIIPRLKEVLDPAVLKAAGVKCVAIDSLTNLCLDIKRTQVFRQRCADNKGVHSPFKEGEALIELLTAILRPLQQLQDYHGIDSICTIDLQIQKVSDTGAIVESRPGLPTFGVGKAVVQQFPDVLVLGRQAGVLPAFETLASVSDHEDKGKGKEKVSVKYIEFFPRLRGVDVLPEQIPADVKEIFKLKSVKLGSK